MFRINHPDDEALVTIARTRLEAAGIDCFGRNEHALRLTGHVHGFFGAHHIELQVRAADAEDAIAMLESESPLEDDESAETDDS